MGSKYMLESSISDAIEQAKRSLPEIADFRVRVGKDSTADLAVWVTLVLDDHVLERIWNRRDELRHRIAEVVRQAVRKEGGEEYWPYVSFQATSEQPKEAVR